VTQITTSYRTADSGGDSPSNSGVANNLRTPSPETPRQLLVRLRAAGVEFTGVERSRLRVKGWRNLTAEDQQAVNQHRQALLALLRAEQEREPRTPPIAPSEYHRFGIYIVHGVPTHALGDEYAADVIAGRIPRPQAEEAERQKERAARELSRAYLRRG
jgi:hypothetical protein